MAQLQEQQRAPTAGAKVESVLQSPAALAQDSGFTHYIHPTALYNELDLRARSRVSLRAGGGRSVGRNGGRARTLQKALQRQRPHVPHTHNKQPNFLLRNLSYRLPCPAPIDGGDG
jgi:hypothetical protein